MARAKRVRTGFFIDYVDADLHWVQWVAWQLEDAGYTVVYREKDFLPGMNIVVETDEALKKAERVIIVLSPDYLKAHDARKTFSGIPVWTTLFLEDVTRGKLLPLHVRACETKGLLKPLIPIEIFNLDEAQARKNLLDGVSRELPVRGEKPDFPGDVQVAVEQKKPAFPTRYRPAFWEVPPENPFFTDREDELTKLYEELRNGPEGRVHTHVINGLSGIGKTQVALAYAYEYRQHYKAVLWIDASNDDTWQASVARLVTVLKLKLSSSERKNAQDIWMAVKDWLEEHGDWLLIFDNIEDSLSMHKLLPSLGNGHVLFTAQTQIVGATAHAMLSLAELKPEDGALFLLKRTRMSLYGVEQVSEHMHNEALKLSRMLGNLPLMLDQAGGYIEDTGVDISRYLEWYSDSLDKGRLLRRRGSVAVDHLEPVIETWNRAFAIVQKTSPAAYDLLRLCAFVHHIAIPEEIISNGATEVLPTLQVFNQHSSQQAEAFIILRKYSLLSQDGQTRTYTMNRMVQEVLKDKMSSNERRIWAERAIVAVTRAFLVSILSDTMVSGEHSCPRYFYHVHACTAYMQMWEDIAPTEGAQLLYQMGTCLHNYFQVHHATSSLDHEHILAALECYALLLKKMDRLSNAEELVAYAAMIRSVSSSFKNAR